MNDRFSKGNRKLSPKILIWNLPRLTTCPGAGACRKWCYEIKIERMYKQTVPFREKNLELTKQADFVDRVVDYLSKRKEPYIRVHESGDFYNQRYLNKWYEIARKLPKKKFFAFTKSFHLDLWSKKPDNFNILQSFGSKWDYRIDWNRATNRAITGDEFPFHDEYLCPSSAGDQGCGEKCTVCMNNPKAHVVGHFH